MTDDLCEALSVYVEYHLPNKQGIVLKDHLIQAGREVPEVSVPHYGQHVYEWFIQLDQARTSNGWGLNPISYVDINAFCNLLGISILEWEVKAIRTMDLAYLSYLDKKGSSNG